MAGQRTRLAGTVEKIGKDRMRQQAARMEEKRGGSGLRSPNGRASSGRRPAYDLIADNAL
ncbi:hypothetical protein CDO73_08130 [Saccharibacillus sp. O23]|nr:hypothetical protein CDO73_08130 [Saccharibacillus sp. O23]